MFAKTEHNKHKNLCSSFKIVRSIRLCIHNFIMFSLSCRHVSRLQAIFLHSTLFPQRSWESIALNRQIACLFVRLLFDYLLYLLRPNIQKYFKG